MTSNLEKMAISTRYKPMLVQPCQKPQLTENKEKHQFLLDTNSAFLLDTNQLSALVSNQRALTTQHTSTTAKVQPREQSKTAPLAPAFRASRNTGRRSPITPFLRNNFRAGLGRRNR
jgi:hypothetical protein